MCGIIGIVNRANTPELLVAGLKRLEYRGYDSAGIAVLDAAGTLRRSREQGKIINLETQLTAAPLSGVTGVGHTRWATHGAPSTANAHPHATDRVAVVHNGIIENHQALREELEAAGDVFTSETDTEVVPHLITRHLAQGSAPEEAVRASLRGIEGAYALAIIFAGHPELMIGARKGSPLAIGYGEEGVCLGSDALALAPFCDRISYLEEGDMVVIHQRDVRVFNADGQLAQRDIRTISSENDDADKGRYAHFMQKEIHEQPRVLARTFNAFYAAGGSDLLPKLPFSLKEIERVTLVACGTSYYAGLVARHWLERIARVSADVDIASEFRYRRPVMPPHGLALFISQSGETADTLAALRYAKSVGQHTVALVNVAESSMAMEADAMLHTRAGREIGVASTKAFTTQLAALACLTIGIARARGTMSEAECAEAAHALGQLSDYAERVLALEPQIAALAEKMKDTRDMFYIGRGTSYAIAYEGALKMKEISYIHAEAYAAGELKHGPLALVSEDVPVLVIAPRDELFEKTASNLQETAARGI
jgi:glucosamine--fructose-6-phosphate aminotransferase (isomerizing)